MQRLYQHITQPFGTLWIILFTAWKTFYSTVWRFPLEDLWHQQTLAINYASGQGLRYLQASATDLAHWTPVTLFKWPPALPWLTGCITRVTGSTWTALTVLDVLSFLLLITAIRKIANLLQFTQRLQWICWIFFLLNPLFTDLLATSDQLSLACWATGFAWLLQTGHQPLHWHRKVLLSFILFSPALFRYQYYPIVFFLPAALSYYGWYHRQQHLQRTGLILMAGIACFVMLQVAALTHFTQQAAYINDPIQWSPHNLQRLNPFFLFSLLPLYQFINQLAGPNLTQLLYYTQLTALFSIVLFILFLLLIKRRPQSSTSTQHLFQQLSLSAIGCLFLLLTLLSLFFKQQVNGSFTFTYVQETRYWSINALLLPLLLFHWLQHQPQKLQQALMTPLLLLLFLVNMNRLYNYFTGNSTTYEQQMAPKTFIATKIETAVQQEKRPVVLAAYDADFALHNREGVYAIVQRDTLLQQAQLSTTKPVWFFLITRDTLTKAETIFITNNHLQFQGSPGPGCRLYRNH